MARERGRVGAAEGAEVLGGPDVARRRGRDAQIGGEADGDALAGVVPVGQAQHGAGPGELARPDVVLLGGVAADELGLLAERVLVQREDLGVLEEVQRRRGCQARVHGRADGERRLVDRPHAKVEFLLLERERFQADDEHVHVRILPNPRVLVVWHNLVGDAPDTSPGVVDIVADSP